MEHRVKEGSVRVEAVGGDTVIVIREREQEDLEDPSKVVTIIADLMKIAEAAVDLLHAHKVIGEVRKRAEPGEECVRAAR